MTATRPSSRLWTCSLLLFSLSIGAAMSFPLSDQEEAKVSNKPKWKTDLGIFVKQAQDEAGKAIDNFLGPTKGFISDVQRWHKWHSGYSKFCNKRKSEQSGCLQANELLMREYSKIDHELYAERRKRELERAKLAGDEPRENSIEQAEHLFELLGRLLDRLEALQKGIESGTEPLPKTSDKEAVEDSVKRLERIVLNTVQGVASNEAGQIGQIATFKMLALILAQFPPAHGTPLSLVAPLIEMLGNPHMPIHLHYLQNLEMRAITGAYDGFIPLMYRQLTSRLGQMDASYAKAAAEGATLAHAEPGKTR